MVARKQTYASINVIRSVHLEFLIARLTITDTHLGHNFPYFAFKIIFSKIPRVRHTRPNSPLIPGVDKEHSIQRIWKLCGDPCCVAWVEMGKVATVRIEDRHLSLGSSDNTRVTVTDWGQRRVVIYQIIVFMIDTGNK